MSTIEAVIKRHSVLIYFALVFVISWGGGFLILGPDRLRRWRVGWSWYALAGYPLS